MNHIPQNKLLTCLENSIKHDQFKAKLIAKYWFIKNETKYFISRYFTIGTVIPYTGMDILEWSK